ncbi:YbaB/EbfC family nucleoid-associated protein [Propionibacteriaceae bacterium G1746]|uniref:YbaB/EbfC family nucleoid-associated protein n=1 Tax=Aestuariimicrobium sp. G57 TaxID=3418485 RepID=UPI003C2900A1
MKPTGFEHAFDSVASVVEQAAALPDHRERRVDSPTVTKVSDGGHVHVTVTDAKVSSMWLDENWLIDTPADEVADLVTSTTNAALEEWNALQLEAIQNVTPDMKQLYAAISTARSELNDAWVATLAEAKTP